MASEDIGANCTLSPSTHSHLSCDCFRIKQNANTHGTMWLLPIPFPIYVAHVHVDHMHGMQGHFRICQCASAIVPGVTSAEVSPWPWWNITKERKSFAKLCWSEPSRTTTTMYARTTGSVERTGRTIPSSRSRSGANYGRSAFAVIRVNRIYCSI